MRGLAILGFLWISANSKQEFLKNLLSFSFFVEFELFLLKTNYLAGSLQTPTTKVCDRQGKNLRTDTDNPSLTRCYGIQIHTLSLPRSRCYPEELSLIKFPKDFDYSSIDLI